MIHGIDGSCPCSGRRAVEGGGPKQCTHHHMLVPGYILRYLKCFVLTYASLPQPLAQPVPTNGTGSAKTWRPCTLAMEAGLMDRVWPLRDVLLYWVSPWQQPQALKATREHEARKGEQAGYIYPQGKLPRAGLRNSMIDQGHRPVDIM